MTLAADIHLRRLTLHNALLFLILFILLGTDEAFSSIGIVTKTHSEQKYNQADFAVQFLNKRRRTRDPSIHVSTTESNIGESNDTSTFDVLQEISDFLPMEEISEILPIEEISESLQEISDNIQEISQQDAVSILQPKTLDRDTLINISIFIFAIATILFQILSVDVGITRGWMPEEIAYRLPIDNWRSYTEVLNTAPVQTKAVTSATVYAIGDIIAQRTEGLEVGELNRARIARSLAAGLIGHGPLSHVWYEVSEDFFENVLKLTEWWSFIPKVVIDQTLWGPFWNNSYIFLLGAMQLQKPSQILSDMKRTTIPLIISGLKLWPLAHCITYGLVPVQNRLLWVDAVEIIWVTILATQASGGNDPDAPTADGDRLEHLHQKS